MAKRQRMKAKVRAGKRVYRLQVDPDRIVLADNVRSWILGILIDAGGTISREDLLDRFTRKLRVKRPKLRMRPSSLLSTHQRLLRDEGVIRIVDERGNAIKTVRRSTVVTKG